MLAAAWPGRHPLRRTIDRIEAMVIIALVVAFLAAAPFAAMATSAWTGQNAAAAAREDQASVHPVAAVVVRGVPPPVSPHGAAYLTKVPVRWTLNGTRHTGTIKAAAGTKTGATVRIWTSRSGEQTDPPAGPAQIAHQAALGGVLAVAGLMLVVIVSALAIRRTLDRRRMATWDAEWRATGPHWCNYL
jgi:hypothetical protein